MQDIFFPLLGVGWLLTLGRQIAAYRRSNCVDLDSVRDDLVHAVEHAVEPTHASLWINSRG